MLPPTRILACNCYCGSLFRSIMMNTSRFLGYLPLQSQQRWNPHLAYMGSWILSPIPDQRHQHLQARTYLFPPVSLDEFKERFQRWVERTEQRLVEVKLVSRRTEAFAPDRRQVGRFVFFQSQRQHASDATSPKATYAPSFSRLPLPETDEYAESIHLSKSFKSRYQGWKARRKEQYQVWKLRGQEQYQGWKRRRQNQYQRLKLQKKQDWLRTKQVLLREYSQPEWFDELGRPLTSRDSTGRFVNPWQSQSTNGVHSIATLLKWRIQRLRRQIRQIGGERRMIPNLLSIPSKTISSRDQNSLPLPLPEMNSERLSLTWLGHSTCWIQINGFTVLTDPIFSHKASPFQSLPIGVARELPPSHSLEDLLQLTGGTIDVCLITHDHYDHLDRGSVDDLASHVSKWVVPLGIADWLIEKCDIPREAIVELEWWQQVHFQKGLHAGVVEIEEPIKLGNDELAITCCPASHWASRTMFDRNKRLWCSFALVGSWERLFFCGDTGYPQNFPLFRQIGDAVGPFDLSCIPIGAYEPADLNKDAHVNPAEAVQIHEDVMSKYSVAMHWGSFPLTEEHIDEPPKALEEALSSRDDRLPPFQVLGHGSTIQINKVSTVTKIDDEVIRERDSLAEEPGV